MGRWDKILQQMPRYAAGLGGAAALGAAATMTPDEANAAGITTIMEKLGVGLEEAQKIKNLAATKLPEGAFEDKIRGIKELSNYTKRVIENPYDHPYPKLGGGADYNAFITPSGNVLKVPASNRGFTDPTAEYAPSLVHQAGLGPKTMTMKLGDKQYMMQEPVSVLDDITKTTQRRSRDPQLENLYKQIDTIHKDSLYNPYSNPKTANALEELNAAVDKRRNELYKLKGIDSEKLEQEFQSLTPQERSQFYNVADRQPDIMFNRLLEVNAAKKLEPKITPWDLHEGNIGLSKEGNPSIFDTSRFKNFRPENLSPEERQKILDANVMLPKDKELLRARLEEPSEDFGTVSDDGTHSWPSHHEENTSWRSPGVTQDSKGNWFSRHRIPPSEEESFDPINGKPNWTQDSKGNWVNKKYAGNEPSNPIPVNAEGWTKDTAGNPIRRSEPIFPKKQAAAIAGGMDLGGLASGANQATAADISPIPTVEKGMGLLNKYVREPVANATQSLVDTAVSGTTPLTGEDKARFVEQTAPVVGGAAQMVTDPMMYVPGGPELDMMMQFPKLRQYLQGNQ